MPSQTRRKPAKRAPDAEMDKAAARGRPQLVALLFCEWANITKEDKHNLIGVFDTITLPPAETLTPQFTLFIRVAHAFDDPLQLRVFGPDDALAVYGEIASREENSNPDNAFQYQVIAQLQFAPKIAGMYWFEILYSGQSLGGAELRIVFAPSQEQ